MKKHFFLIICAAMVLGLLTDSVWAKSDQVKIGWIGPLSGAAAESGVAIKQGSILALEEWNAKGGIYIEGMKKRIPVEILFEDCQSKPEVGVSLGVKFIDRDKVHMLLADALHSHVTLAIMELANKYGLPMMSIAPVSSEISGKIADNPDKYWSFWKGNIATEGYSNGFFETYKDFIDQKLIMPKNKTIAFFVEDSDYGRSYITKITALFDTIGWKRVAAEVVPIGHTDCYMQFNKIKSLEPDILFTCFTSVSSGVAAVRQFHEVGLKCSHFGIYYTLKPEFVTTAGKDADYLLWSPMSLDPSNVPHHKEFAEKVKKRWDVTLNWDIAIGYDVVNNALDSIERAGSLDPKKIVDALSNLDRRGVLGRYVFDQAKHEVKHGPEYFPVPTAQIVGGESAIIWPSEVANKKYETPPWLK